MKTLLITALGCFISMCCIAQMQSTTVKLLDLSVYPSTQVDSITGLPVDTTIVSFNLDFKINNVAEANQARLLIGTTKNSDDVINLTATFSQSAGQYFLNCNNTSNVVNGYNARIKASLTGTQESAFHYITLYLIDSQGKETNRLYFTK